MAEENILVIQLSQLGDILLTTPCLKAIRLEKPHARITFLSQSMGKRIIDDSPYVDEHFHFSKNISFLESIKLAKTLRSRKFDAVYDFMNNPRSAFYALFSGAPRRIAFTSSRKIAYTESYDPPNERSYIVEEKFELLRKTGFTPNDIRLVLPWHEAHTKPTMQLWGQNPELKKSPFNIVISPTHRREHRKWPLKYYAVLADKLVAKWGAEIIWIWGPGEESVINQVMSYCSQPTIKAPPTSFREAAALMANMDLFIGNSNGPSHVAVAVNVCSYQLHGHTHLKSWCPLNLHHRGIQAPSFLKVKIPDMAEITLDAVWTELEDFKPYIEKTKSAKGSNLSLNWQQ